MSLAWLIPAVLAPAAPDNRPGIDTDALWACRRINALPTTSRKEKP